MNIKLKIKMILDVLMTAALLLLMSYSMVGRNNHELIGIALMFMFIMHHILNSRWSKNVTKGKYTPYRILQTIIAISLLICMLGSMVSGMIISRYVFKPLPVHIGRSLARNVHMLTAYWGFIIMSIHLGLHWNMIVRIAGTMFKKESHARTRILRTAVAGISLYGIYAFMKHNIYVYLLLQVQFAFFDNSTSFLQFMVDYVAIMVLFVCIGYVVSRLLFSMQNNKNLKERE